MTETALRTRTHISSYAITGLCFLILAQANLRYGLYELFFGALIVAVVSGAGAAYAFTMRRQQLTAKAHLPLLALAGLTTLGCITIEPEMASIWLFPLVLLNLLILRIRQALVLSAAVIAVAMLIMSPVPAYERLSLLTALLLLGGAAAWFAFRYHYSARYVDTLTIIDPETGAYNRRCLDETLAKEISRSEATGHSLSLALLSVDHLDELRNVHGGAQLPELFRAISTQLGTTMRAGDSHYYLGDGRFYLLLPFTHEEGLRVIAERIRRLVGESRWPVAESITASLGCTTRTEGETSVQQMKERCTEALEEAQRRGHDQVWHLNTTATHSSSSTSCSSTSSRSRGSSISSSD